MTLVDKEAERRETKKSLKQEKSFEEELARMLTLASKARSNTLSVQPPL